MFVHGLIGLGLWLGVPKPHFAHPCDGLADVDLYTHANVSSASERTQKYSKLSDSNLFSSPTIVPFNTNLRLTGPEMAGHLPRIFDVFALRAFQATQQPDGLQVSA